jgi:hypothetical protein
VLPTVTPVVVMSVASRSQTNPNDTVRYRRASRFGACDTIRHVKRPFLGALFAMIIAAVLAGCGSDAATPPGGSVAPGGSTPAGQASANWDLAADQSAAAGQAGLPMLGQEMLAVHYHAHIDLMIRGKSVTVPSGIGIDFPKKKISPLHTHDETGIVHIESAEDTPFTLGQFFTEWGQHLDSRQVGPVTVAAGEQLRVFHDGKEVTGDPAAIRLTQHGEFYVWLGPADKPPSAPISSYAFPKGL